MKKFKVSFDGLFLAIKDKSVKIQCILGLLAIIAAIILKFTMMEWIVFIVCIGLVIASEIFNTCIERLCDLVQPEYDERVRKIKDMSSAAVLVVSIMAFIIAVIIGLKYLI